jgi:hypothetical protein
MMLVNFQFAVNAAQWWAGCELASPNLSKEAWPPEGDVLRRDKADPSGFGPVGEGGRSEDRRNNAPVVVDLTGPDKSPAHAFPSYNGNTAGFEPANFGSNPWGKTSCKAGQRRYAVGARPQ